MGVFVVRCYIIGCGLLNGEIYALGGNAGFLGRSFVANESYNPVTNTWTIHADMTMPRRDLAVAVLGGYVYATHSKPR